MMAQYFETGLIKNKQQEQALFHCGQLWLVVSYSPNQITQHYNFLTNQTLYSSTTVDLVMPDLYLAHSKFRPLSIMVVKVRV